MENKHIKIRVALLCSALLFGSMQGAQINKSGRPTPKPGVQGFKVQTSQGPTIAKPLPPTPSKRASAGSQSARPTRPTSVAKAETKNPEFDTAMSNLKSAELLTPLNTQRLAVQKQVGSLGSNISTKGIETAMSTLTKLYEELSAANPDLAGIAQRARGVANGAGLKQSEKTQKNIQAVKSVRQLAHDIASTAAQLK